MRDTGRVERKLNRREALVLAGGVGAAALVPGCSDDEAPATTAAAASSTATADCVLMPELTEGPYYLDLNEVRSDIAETRPGLPFDLTVRVVDAESCKPVKDAAVDVWHCDAGGAYSGVGSETGETFLRGTQVTDAGGAVLFRTIFPGWYSGRAVHIHLKVHVGTDETHTGQLFFADDVLAKAYESEPYADRGDPDTPNAADQIYGQSNGTTIVSVTPGETYTGAVTLGVQRA
jgi:protocatechuate 3,4-dioxygenase beta subunit